MVLKLCACGWCYYRHRCSGALRAGEVFCLHPFNSFNTFNIASHPQPKLNELNELIGG